MLFCIICFTRFLLSLATCSAMSTINRSVNNWDHWEDFTTLTEWEKLVQSLNMKILESFPHSEPSVSSELAKFSFSFVWKRQPFQATLYLSMENEHLIGTLIGYFPFVTVEPISESHNLLLHVCCNEARLLLSAWLLASKDTWLESMNCFCSFVQDDSTNYVGYCRNLFTHMTTNYISHSFPFVPENAQNFSMLVDWTREKQRMLESDNESLQLELVIKHTVEPFPDRVGIYLVEHFDRIFAIGTYRSPVDWMSVECLYESSNSLESITEHVLEKKMLIRLIEWKEKEFIFSNALIDLHNMIVGSSSNSRISDCFPLFQLSLQQNDDFLNLFTFLFNGKSGTFSSRLTDSVLFVLQKESSLLSTFWSQFCVHLRESYGTVSTKWIEGGESDSITLKLASFENYCTLLLNERHEAELNEGKKRLLDHLNLWEPFVASTHSELIGPKLQLSSDMQAFKAANADCSFSDFIRWYSPNDWNEEEGCLSARMSNTSEWKITWDSCNPIPIYNQSFTERLNEFVNVFEAITIQELIEFCMPRALESLTSELTINTLFNKYPIIQERLSLLQNIVENFCWTEYFIEPQEYSLDEIVEHLMRIELYSLLVEFLSPHFNVSQIQELLLYCRTKLEHEFEPDESPLFNGKSIETQIGRIISPSLQVYAIIGRDSFHILEGQSELC